MIHKPLHPGEIIREICITETGLSITEAAERLGVDRVTLSRLLNGRTGISAEMAMRLAIALDGSPILWLDLQRDYDLWKLSQRKKPLKVKKIKEVA